MGFSLDVSVPVLTVFLQGLISFFSPCVLPLLPLYIGYLSGGTGKWEDGKFYYKKSKVMINTLFFVIGISFAFVLLGLGVSAVGSFLNSNQELFAKIGGVLVVLFGLYQLGIFGSSDFLGKERRLPFRLDKLAMSPFAALLMGFTFSFAWTPCVGPALTSVLLMAASTGTRAAGMGLIGVYTIGFVLPFLAVGIFATSLLGLFRKHMKVVQYTVKIGGILMIIMGILMFTGKMNAVTSYLSNISSSQENTENVSGTEEEVGSPEETSETEDSKVIPALDFTLKDQFGNTHTLADYKGKTIFLNFWATWCGPCKAELPDIQKLYEKYSEETEEEVVVLGVAGPKMGNEKTEEEIIEFLEENELTYPVLMDTDWTLFQGYGISSFPTTFMIDKEGNVFGYVPGQLSYDIMEDIIRQTKEGR
ncbi:MAG: cytochrome c biogenesis protein CcdA [Blautia sp.]|nr:cytochrome c biogenesis protein CcdA [Eubacteriales bacterium]MED9966226.1 cytochrome c biogenesis protein CcdA [Blautia sp.]